MVMKEPTVREVKEAVDDALIAHQEIRARHHRLAHAHPAAQALPEPSERSDG